MNAFKTKNGTELPILNLRGKDYLEVKYRLVWFREEHPTWGIETEVTARTEKSACMRALIKDDAGRVVAMAHKTEDVQGFGDFLEKAETGAIGRALALIGYGTQFCADELDEGARIVDSPVSKPNPHAAKNFQPGDGEGDPHAVRPYVIPFGKFQKRTLEEVGPDALRSYVDYIETKAAKDNKPITGQVKDFIDRAVEYIVAIENGPTDKYPDAF